MKKTEIHIKKKADGKTQYLTEVLPTIPTYIRSSQDLELPTER